MKSLSVAFQVKAIEQYFLVALFVSVLYRPALNFDFVDEILKCYHSGESY